MFEGYQFEDYLKASMAFVGLLRVFGVYNAFITPNRLRTNVYSKQPREATALLTRLFGFWTALSGSICFAIYYDPTNVTLLIVGIVSFFIALFHFITELFIFNTCGIKDACIPFVVASSSIYLLYLQLQRVQSLNRA